MATAARCPGTQCTWPVSVTCLALAALPGSPEMDSWPGGPLNTTVDTEAALTDTATEPGAARLFATSTATSTVPSTTAAVNQAHQGTVLARPGLARPGTSGTGCTATPGLVPANPTIMRHSMVLTQSARVPARP